MVRTALNLAALFAPRLGPADPVRQPSRSALALGEPFPPTWPGADIPAELARVPAGRQIETPPVLFRKIEDAQVAEWTQMFAGVEAG